jgi:hypothetical protein
MSSSQFLFRAVYNVGAEICIKRGKERRIALSFKNSGNVTEISYS